MTSGGTASQSAAVSIGTEPLNVVRPASFTTKLNTPFPKFADTSPWPPDRVARKTAGIAGPRVTSSSATQYATHEANRCTGRQRESENRLIGSTGLGARKLFQ